MTPPPVKFDDPPGEVSPALTATTFAQTPLGRAAAMLLDGMRTRFTLEHCTSLGRPFKAEIIYDAQHLDRIELFLLLPGDNKGWESWSEDGERNRKQQAEAWIADMFGQKPAVLPFEFEGQWITPFETKWDTLQGLRFPWGEVTSYFDSKGGFSGLLIRYTR
jgi:hypothetical protein